MKRTLPGAAIHVTLHKQNQRMAVNIEAAVHLSIVLANERKAK